MQNSSTKLKNLNIPVVSEKYLIACIEGKAKLDTKKYILKVNDTKSRPEPEEDGEEGPPTRKPKGIEEEGEEEGPSKSKSSSSSSSEVCYLLKEGKWLGTCFYKKEAKNYPFTLKVKTVKDDAKKN